MVLTHAAVEVLIDAAPAGRVVIDAAGRPLIDAAGHPLTDAADRPLIAIDTAGVITKRSFDTICSIG